MRLILIVLSAAILMPSWAYSGDLPKWMTGDHGMRIVKSTGNTPEAKAERKKKHDAYMAAHNKRVAEIKKAQKKGLNWGNRRSAIIFNGDGTTSLIIY